MDVVSFVRHMTSIEADTALERTLAERMAQSEPASVPALEFRRMGLRLDYDPAEFVRMVSTTRFAPDRFDRFYRELLTVPMPPAIARDYRLEAVLHCALAQRDFPANTIGVSRPSYVHIGADVSPFLLTAERTANLEGLFFWSPEPGAAQDPIGLDIGHCVCQLWRGQPESTDPLEDRNIVLLAFDRLGEARTVTAQLALLGAACTDDLLLVVQDRADVIEELAEALTAGSPDVQVASFADAATERAILAASGTGRRPEERTPALGELPAVAVRGRATRSNDSFPVRLTAELPEPAPESGTGSAERDSRLLLRPARSFARPRVADLRGSWPLRPEERELLDDPRMPTPEQTCAIYHGATANGAGVIVTRDHELAEESFLPLIAPDERTFWGKSLDVRPGGEPRYVGFHDGHFLIEGAAGRFHTTTEPESKRSVEGPALLLGGLYHHVFSHWIYDILAKAWMLPELRARGLEDPSVIVPGPLTSKQFEMLERVGVPAERVVPLAPREWASFERLYVPSRPIRMYDYIIPEVFRMYADFVRPGAARADLPRRFYIARTGLAYRRNLLNEAHVLDCLRPFGFEPVVFDEMSLEDEVALFAQAEIVVCPHGSAMASMCFMQPGSSVLCLVPRNLSKVIRHHQNICAHTGSELRILFGDYFDSREDIAHWIVDVDLLEAMAARMLEERDGTAARLSA